jgi:recombination protein RecA
MVWSVFAVERAMEDKQAAALQQLIATVQRRWGARALRWLGDVRATTIPAVVSTGFADLDIALGIGGVPRGRITEFLGTPTSGMTTIALRMLGRAQAGGDLAGYVDLSKTFDAEYAALLGIDLATLLLIRPTSAADALEITQALINSGGLGVLIVDCLALLQSVPADAALLERALRLLSGALAESPCALIVLTPLPYSPDMTRSLAFSGSLLAHAAAIRLHVAREDWVAAEYGPPGCHARVSVLKHQLAAMGGEAQVLIRFPDEVR